MITNSDIERGKLLLAEPFMLDNNFKKAVIVLCDHEENGSVGFILNKPLGMTVNDLLVDFPDFPAPVYYGGPVQTDTIHYLHNQSDILRGSYPVTKGISWGGEYEQLKTLIGNGLIQQHNIRFFCGYAGWSSGQLSEELLLKSWMLADMDINYAFQPQEEGLWKTIMQHKGDQYRIIADMSESFNFS